MPLIQWILNLLDVGGAAQPRVGCLRLAQRERATVRVDDAPASTLSLSQSSRATVSLSLEVC